MKTTRKNQCGRQVERMQVTPAQEVLADHGEIFSCGGVYLGLNRDEPRRPDRFEFWQLPNHAQETLVLNNHQVQVRASAQLSLGDAPLQEPGSAETALRRFFKESLN